MSPQRIQRKRTKGWTMPEGAVYVGRPSRWGNPWRFPDLSLSVALYTDMVNGCWNPTLLDGYDEGVVGLIYRERQRWLDRLGKGHPIEIARAELASLDLACWCPVGQPCHADVLLRVANGGAS